VTRAFQHQALLYDSADELVDAALPFVREGLERGEPVLGVLERRNLDALGVALGADADRLELHDTAQWHPNAFERLRELARLVARVPEDGAMRALGQPAWNGSAAVNWVPPARAGGGGWGLPIARQLCDALEIARGGDGAVVTLYVALGR
jgi:MEDS: MEthanogen/methylotroph, DcmR Sensory domain